MLPAFTKHRVWPFHTIVGLLFRWRAGTNRVCAERFVTWFVVIAIPDSPILFPWLNDMVDESLECIFLWWVLWTFRARKFNNVALVSPTGGPLPGQYELAVSVPGNAGEAAASKRICILNPVEDNPERPYPKRSISIGVPADMSSKDDAQK